MIFPTSGSMRNGSLYRLPPWEPRSSANASSSSPTWPTPRVTTSGMTASEAQLERIRSGLETERGKGACKLEISAALWPTPRTSDTNGAGLHGDGGLDLRTTAAMWPTPNVPNGGRTMSPADVEAKGATAKGKRQVGLENVAKFWPTPKAGAENYGQPREDDRGDLQAATSLWATPAARDWKSGQASEETTNKNSRPLNEQALWRTPCVRDNHPCGRENRTKHEATYQLAHQVVDFPSSLPDQETPPDGQPSSESIPTSRRLSVAFVEFLQNFPIGWTDLKPLETQSYLSRLRMRLWSFFSG